MMGGMHALADVVELHPDTVDQAAAWYASPPPPATFQLVHPAVLAAAWELSQDWHRCTLTPDHRPGCPPRWALVVHNQAVW